MLDTIENQAVLSDNGIIDHAGCEECTKDYIFAMKDNYHEFQIGLRTILECLSMAEQEKAVPPLPEDWWEKINRRY
ncbi:MAG: hypothetical protein LUE23_08930 [Lachnospiraceae bacterium]|nr:hypothetical protein [Lachnospiraceae bacterium]